MGNTVGSQRNLTTKQKEVLLGTLLGDGILELNGRYVRLRIDHSHKQKAYVEWKYGIFRNLIRGKIRHFLQKLDSRTKKRYSHCKFDTISTPLLNEFYRMFYIDGRKRVPKNIVEILKKPLSLNEQKLLQKSLLRNFRIKTKLHRKGKFWNIYIPNRETVKFCKIVKTYIIPEMKYKISLTP